MLGLGALELHPLGCHVSRAAIHLYPVLHLINELENSQELRSNLELGQGALESGEQKREVALERNSEDTKLEYKPQPNVETGNRKTKDTSLSSATVMLGAVERGPSVEVPASTQGLLFQESVESTSLQVRAEFVEISLHPKLPSLLNRKDVHVISESVPTLRENTTGMVAMGTEAVLPLEQSETVNILQTGTSESTDLRQSGPSGEVSDTSSLITIDQQTSSESLLSRENVEQESSVSTSNNDHLCPFHSRNEEDLLVHSLCLEDQHLTVHTCMVHPLTKQSLHPLTTSLDSKGFLHTFDREGSESFSSSSWPEQTEEARSAIFIPVSSGTSADPNRAEKLKENTLQNVVSRDQSSGSIMFDQQAKDELPFKMDQNCQDSPDVSRKLSEEAAAILNTADICMEHAHSFVTSKSCLTSDKFLCMKEISEQGEALEKILSKTPNPTVQPDCVEAAKTLDTQQCFSSQCHDECIDHHISGSSDCHKHQSSDKEIVETLEHSSTSNHILPVPATAPCIRSPPCTQTIIPFSLNTKVECTTDHMVCDAIKWEMKLVETKEQLCLDTEDKDSNGESPISDREHTLQCGIISTEQSLSILPQNEWCTQAVKRTVTPITCRAQAGKSLDMTEIKEANNPNQKIHINITNDVPEISEVLDPSKQINIQTTNLTDPSKHVPNMCSQAEENLSVAVTHANSSSLNNMHSDTPDSSISSPENLLASPQTISICKTAAEYAIVPYKDIFGFLSGTKVPPTQCKVKFQDSYEEGIQNEMARSHFLDEEDPSAFTLIGCSLQQVAEDMLKPQGKDHSQKHKENNYSSPEEYMSTMHSIKQSGACQELALHLFPPPDKMSLCEIPVVTVSEGSDLSTLGGATYLGEDSRDHKPYVCPGSTDIVELLNPQHDSTLVQGNYLFSSSVEVADISLTRSDTLSNDQINESPTQPELGQTQPLKFFDEPHEGDNGKSVEGISISTLDSSRPVCVVKHRKTEEKNHRGNKEELGDSQFHIANHELMPAEQMGEVPVIPASEEIVQRCLRSDSIMKVACESSVTDGSPQVHVLSHETNSVSMTNVQSLVLCDTAIHFTSDLENNSSVRSWTDSHAGDVEVSIKRKRGCDKIQQSMQKFETRQKKPVRQKYKCISKSSKESVNHSSGCDMEITASVSTENNIKHVPEQRPKHKSLTTIKCQDAKLPKICKTHDAEPSQHTRTQPAKDSVLNCNRRSPEITMRLRPRPPKITSDTKDLQSTLSSSSHLPSNISLKKQPSKRLKCITLQEGAKATHQQTTCNSDTMMCSTSVPEDQYRFMQLKQDMAPMPLVSEATTKLMSYKLAQKSVIPYMKPTILQKYTKEQSLLHQLSSLACKLTTPFKSSSYKLKPVSRRFENPSFGGVQLKARKLLEVFSCFNMKLISPSEEICSKVVPFSPARDCLTSQQMALYPASSSRTEFFNLSDRFSLGPSLCTAFPVSSHMKEDSGQLSNFVNFTSPLYMIEKPASTTQLPQLSEWTLSLLLSPHKPAASEHIHLFTHWQPHLRALEASSSGSRHKTSSVRRGAGCAMLGLHTILALSSPGCYRLWTRKRNLGSRLPTVQRLSINQFAQGLKELQPRVLRTGELYSSLPYTLGRVLSTWSQHGPSTSSSDCAALHTSCCLLQPIPSINIRSPDSLLGAAPLLLNTSPPRWNIHCLKEKPSLAIVPKTCQHQEDLSLPFSLSPPKALVHSFEQSEALPVPCVRVQNSSKDNVKEELGRKPQRVSQIRIRKTVPKPDPNLTPMGLPKAKRLNKKEFSLEDIYTNKNYKSPPVARSLETIFEEPKEKDGILVSLSHQKRKRVLEFRDCTVPRVKRAKGKVKVAIGCKRGRKAAVEGLHLDALLIQKLMELENFLLEEEAVEKAQAAAERVS